MQVTLYNSRDLSQISEVPGDKVVAVQGVSLASPGAPGVGLLDESNYPIFIQLLGRFRLFKAGRPLTLPGGGKIEAILSILALNPEGVTRDYLLSSLWLDHEHGLASQSLNSLIYSLRKLLNDGLNGAPPVLCLGNTYRLNYEAGIGVDAGCFDELVRHGNQLWRQADTPKALTFYGRALELYKGDLWSAPNSYAVVERERLRVSYLELLSRLCDYYYARADYDSCLNFALRMLASDPCREDAHRLMMRCYVRRGERGQALRQYRLCVDFLQSRFGALPEAATTKLYEQIRLTPNLI